MLADDDDIDLRLIVHPPWWRLDLTIKQYGMRLRDACGWQFVAFLVFSQLLGKGLLTSVARKTVLPFFRDRVDPATLQIYEMIIMIPWGAKPLIGLLSDYLLIFGFHKRGWLIIGALLGITASALLFVTERFYILMILCFMGLNVQISLYDLLSEAKYSEIRDSHPHLGSNLSTLSQGLIATGSLLALCFVGFLAEGRYFHVLFAMLIGISSSLIVPTLLGWLSERRDESRARRPLALVDAYLLWADRWFVLVVAFCGVSGIICSLVVTLATPISGFVVALILLFVCVAGAWLAFPAGITQIAMYQVLTTLSQPIIGTALDYFYTASEECLPGGPNFPYSYYIAYAGIVGTILGLVGVFAYQFIFSRMRFRPVLLITSVCASLAGLSDVLMVLRINVRLGISDRVAYMIGEAVLEPFLGMLNWIPVSALIALEAPDGKKATCFAFVAGISNFSRMVSELSGAILIQEAGIVATGTECHFENLWWLVLLCHLISPLIVNTIAVFLIPNKRQDD